ncbi:MAG: CoA-binding protein [Candidatus Helarchaeota archaeon]|nr:CoA-binding protein [Candidatus Helarchaeota archaeon]
MDIDFTSLFKPKSIAFFGAKESRAGLILPYKEMNFPGKLFLLSDTEDEVFGLKCWKSVFDFPDAIDLAIISLRNEDVPQAIKDCQKKGVKFAIIFTAGFGEKDRHGKDLEGKILQIIKDGGPRIIGPNCMGVYCPEGRIGFVPDFPTESGPVAFLSQSGGLAIEFIFDGMHRGFRFSKVVSIGNSIDLSILDFLAYLDSDPQTKVICIYIEGIGNGQKLTKILKNMNKPVVFLKGGKTVIGKRAVKSHTGALSGNLNIWNAISNQTKAIFVENLMELQDCALSFTYSQFIPRSKKVALINASGGGSVLETDACSTVVELPQFSTQVKKVLKKYYPAWVTPQNPLDLPATYRKPRLIGIFEVLATADIDLVILTIPARVADPYWDKIRENNVQLYLNNVIKGGNILKAHKKLFFISIPPSYFYKEREMLRNAFLQEGFPVFDSAYNAAKAFLKLYDFYK